jgi:hypothetical protein
MLAREYVVSVLCSALLAGCVAPAATAEDNGGDQAAVTAPAGTLHSECTYHTFGASDCNAGLTCRPTSAALGPTVVGGLWCVANYGNYRCEYGGKTTEVCENDKNCAIGLICAGKNANVCRDSSLAAVIVGDYVYFGACALPASSPNGATCSDNRECASGNCDSHQCKIVPCTGDPQCSDPTAPLCENGACVALHPIGAVCTDDHQCAGNQVGCQHRADGASYCTQL